MITRTYIVTVQADDRTTFSQDEEFYRVALRRSAEWVFSAETRGTIPAVLVTTPVNKHQAESVPG